MLSASLARHLAALGLVRYDGAGPLDAPVAFVEDMPDQPEQAVGILARPGRKPEPLWAYDSPDVQVIVRGAVESPGGRARTVLDHTQAIYDALEGTSEITWAPGTVDELEVLTCDAANSAPTPLGLDAAGRPRYSLVFEVEHYNPARVTA